MVTRRLGRGLDSLIARSDSANETVEAPPQEIRWVDPRHIVVNPDQPRTVFDNDRLDELAESIRREGLLQPLVVREREPGEYELVAGERRLRASLKVNLTEIPVIVRTSGPEKQLELALIENIQRQDLNPIELAQAYQKLKIDKGWTQEEVAERLGKKRSSVANTLRLLELEPPIQEALSRGEISTGHAKVLLSKPASERATLLAQILEGGLTVRELESDPKPTADHATAKPQGTRPKNSGNDPIIRDQEELLSRSLGTKVQIKAGRGQKGKIVIDYFSADDFERIREILTDES